MAAEHVEQMREAARLIRQRAEAAKGRAPLPWRQTISDSESPTGVGICEDHRQAEPMWPCENCWAIETWSEPVAEHIASWHPGVALLVADWLEAEADGYVTYDDNPECPSCAFGEGCSEHEQRTYHERCTEPSPCDCIVLPLALARAYLGRSDGR